MISILNGSKKVDDKDLEDIAGGGCYVSYMA
jgi:hypothetical protein